MLERGEKAPTVVAADSRAAVSAVVDSFIFRLFEGSLVFGLCWVSVSVLFVLDQFSFSGAM